MVNQRQLIVFKAGLLQVLLGLLMLFLLLRCTPKDTSSGASRPISPAISTDTIKGQIHLVDNSYVPIAGHYTEETKQKLRDLETLKFQKFTIADQVLDYLKLGENDFGVEFKFIDLRFEKRDAVINEKVAHEISDLATIMKQFPNMKIKLMCYTDNKGDEKSNQKLTENRVSEVKNRIVAQGIEESRIQTKAFGEKYPVGDNKTYDGQLINNRIEMMILSK